MNRFKKCCIIDKDSGNISRNSVIFSSCDDDFRNNKQSLIRSIPCRASHIVSPSIGGGNFLLLSDAIFLVVDGSNEFKF